MLDLSAAFDTIDHNIPIIWEQMAQLLSGLLPILKTELSLLKLVDFSRRWGPSNLVVSQGSVLGPVLFTMYTQPLVHIMRKFNIRFHL